MKKQKFNKKFTEEDYVGYFGVIYKITNTINNKLYIGQTVDFNNRTRLHEETGFNKNAECYNYPLYRAIRKYGITNFEIEIIEHCSSLDELNEREIYYIATLDTIIDHGKGYNLEYGGYNGLKSEYTKAKMRISQRGENNPSYGRKGNDALRAIKIIDLDTLDLYGSMIDCAEKIYNDRSAMKQLSRITNLENNRLSYKGKHFARVDKFNNVYIKTIVAKVLGIDYNANGKSYIILTIDELKNTLSKRA